MGTDDDQPHISKLKSTMAKNADKSFLTADPDDLSPQQREEYLNYWASQTPGERLTQAWRLTAKKWGIPIDQRMDKTKISVRRFSAYPDEKS